MRLLASQRRKKGTVKSQAYNTPATNPDASPVHLVDDHAGETVKAQVCLRASQQRVKGMAKTQASHTPATNSDALPVLAVDDSARETVKAQARHSPATCIVFPTIHPAANSAWKNLTAESVPVRDTSDKVIFQDGRSDPTAHSFEELRLADAGICLATRSEPDEAPHETSLGRGLVILTVNIVWVSLKKEVLFPKTCWPTTRCSPRTVRFGSTLSLLRHAGCLQSSKKVLLPLFPATRRPPRTARFGSSFSVFRSLVLLIFASGSLGAVFVNPLFAQLYPDLLHLPITCASGSPSFAPFWAWHHAAVWHSKA